jgi:hypothetical protein
MVQKETVRQPKNIFEQIAIGLEVTNANTVAISEDLAVLSQKVDDIYKALFIQINSEPNASGAEDEK